MLCKNGREGKLVAIQKGSFLCGYYFFLNFHILRNLSHTLPGLKLCWINFTENLIQLTKSHNKFQEFNPFLENKRLGWFMMQKYYSESIYLRKPLILQKQTAKTALLNLRLVRILTWHKSPITVLLFFLLQHYIN